MSATKTEIRCAGLLRDLRRKKGLTLDEFEKLSKGQVKAVVLGSYERGTRAISLARLEQLCELYEVPIQYFFNESSTSVNEPPKRFIFDVRRVNRLQGLDEPLINVRKYLSTIVHRRSDWNGQIISIRESDSENLSLITSLGIVELSKLMDLNGFLFRAVDPKEELTRD